MWLDSGNRRTFIKVKKQFLFNPLQMFWVLNQDNDISITSTPRIDLTFRQYLKTNTVTKQHIMIKWLQQRNYSDPFWRIAHS